MYIINHHYHKTDIIMILQYDYCPYLFIISFPTDMRFTPVTIGCVLVSSIAGPITWYLWIHTGSANANFFFALTLTYSISQIFLLLDVCHSYLTHQYDMTNGLPRTRDKLGTGHILLKLQ